MQAQRFGANKIVWARTAAWIPVDGTEERASPAVAHTVDKLVPAAVLERRKAKDGKMYCRREFDAWYSYGGCHSRHAYATIEWEQAQKIANPLKIEEKAAEVSTWRQRRFSRAHESVEFSLDEIIKLLPSVNFSPDEIIKLLH